MAHIVGVPKRDPCQKCGLPVFLAERLMIEKNVYHRTCLRCARCNSQLTPGNFYETEIDGEYCCETCPDEEKKLDVATSSKDRAVEPVKPISGRLASFEKDGTKVLQKSLSDEEKSQSLKKLTENQLQYIYKPNSARSSFLNNPSSGEYDSCNSSRRNSDSSIDTTSSDKTNDDVSKVPPELPKSLPPLFSKDDTQASSSFHIQESIKSTIEHDSKTTPEIPHLQNIQVETIICDMSSAGELPSSEPSVVDVHKSEFKTKTVEIEDDISGAIPKQEREVPDMKSIQIKTYINNDTFPNQMASIRLLEPSTIRFKSGENKKTFPLHPNDTMDSKFEDSLNSGSNFESIDKPQLLETNLSILTTENEETTGIKKGVCEETPQQIKILDMGNIQIDRYAEQQITNPNIEGIQTDIYTLSEDGMDFKSQNSLEEYIPQKIQIPNMKHIRVETDICDPTLPNQQALESLDPCIRFKSGEAAKELHSESREKPRMKTGILLPEKNEGSSRKSIDKTQTETPKLSTGPFDQQQDNSVEVCNDLNLIKHSINVTKDNSENDGEMRTIDVPTTLEYIRKSPKTDAEQPVVDSERVKSMVRARLHQFENIANKSQNSSISSLSKNRISHSTNASSVSNSECPQIFEKELNTINLQAYSDCLATDSIASEMEENASCTSTEKRPKEQSDSSEDIMKSCSDELSEFDKSKKLHKLRKSDASDKLEKPDNSDQLENSDTSDQLDKPDNFEKLEKSYKSDKSDKSDNSEKLEKSYKSDKSEKSDNSEKLDKSYKSDKSEKSDNSEKLDKSDILDKSALKVGKQKKKSDDYPEELNPFKSDEEEDNQSSQRKTNPFESSDEDEEKSKSKVTHSNPFGSESEDDNVSSRSGKLPVPTPRITKSSEKVAPAVTQIAMLRTYEGSLQNTQDCCCCAAGLDEYQDVRSSKKSTCCSCSRGVTKNRKKKPAPQPPKVSKEIFSSINQDSKKSSPGSSTASTPTTVRKKRPAPSPPGLFKTEGCSQAKKDLPLTSMESATSAQEEVKIEEPHTQLEKLCDEEKALLESSTNISSNESSSITLDQGDESTKTSKRRLIALDASLVEDANSSEDLKLKEEDNVIYRRTLVPPVLDDSTLSPSSDTSESHDRQLEKMKDNKEAKNRNRQSQISLPSEENDPLYNKSVHGKWKRRKGPAPALPIPPKKVLQMLPLQEIRHELEIIEVQQQGLEKQGVMLEKMIRERCEGPAGGDNIEGNPNPPNSKEVEDLILQLFELVNEKNELFRRQAELMYLRRQHRLEQEQADLEYEIRVLMAQPERNKTDSDKAREEALIARLVEVVQLRNEVVECLEMDRLREAEEDLSIKQRLEMHSAKRDEELSKQTPTKLSKKEKKKQKEHKKIGKSKKLDADKDADESELNAEKQKAKKKKKKFLF